MKTSATVLLLGAASLLVSCGGGGGPAPAPAPVTPLPPVAATDVLWQRFTPDVIPHGMDVPVLFEAGLTGPRPASVKMGVGSATLALADDGTLGDRQANDNIWTVQIQARQVLALDEAQYVQRPFVGFLEVAGSGDKFNVFAETWSPSVGQRTVHPVDQGGQETDYVVNYVATTAQMRAFDPAVWTRRFYQTHADDFDFINIVQVAGNRGNRYHRVIKNTVQGIGLEPIDNAAQFGSAGRLKGWNNFPIPFYFDLGSPTALHETAHQWLAFVKNTALRVGAHFAVGNISANVMGVSLPPTLQGGVLNASFTPLAEGWRVDAPAELQSSTFNTMELYLMGLVPAAEVGPFFVLKNQNLALTQGMVLNPSDITVVPVADVVAANGVRQPAAGAAQKDFRMATIIVSERQLDPISMSLYDHFARRGEAREVQAYSQGFARGRANPWYLATGGRSVLSTRIRQ